MLYFAVCHTVSDCYNGITAMNKKLPRSVKKYLRREKARLRRTLDNPLDLQQALEALVARFRGREE
jgi:hypothetical protein